MNLGGMAKDRIYSFHSFNRFCIDSITTCLSIQADKVCVPFALSVLSAMLLFLSCFVLIYQRCNVKQGNAREVVACAIYCLLGNMCNTVGAVLSQQLAFQIAMGVFAAAADFVTIVSIFFSLYLCRNSAQDMRLRMIRRRRRQNLLVLCVLMGFGVLFTSSDRNTSHRPYTQRKLLHALLQDNTEILGYTLGLISFVIACTSKLPAITRACRGEKVTWAGVFSGLLCSTAGVLHTSAILLCDTRPGFLLKAMPWLLAATCSSTLDLLKNNVKTISEIGDYMDVSVQPARKARLKEMLLSVKEVFESRPLTTRAIGGVRVNSFSSCSSWDSSSGSSDLEWDFEEASTHWREPAGRQEKDEFPLQEWPNNPAPFAMCICGMSELT